MTLQGEGDLAKIKTYQRCAGIIFCRKGKGTFSGDGIYSWKFVERIWQSLWKTLQKEKFIVDDQDLQSAE